MANNRSSFNVSLHDEKILQRVYSNYQTLTFFFQYSRVGAAAAESLNGAQCIQDFHVAPQGHPQHDLFHFNEQDHDQVHAHLIKGKQFFEDISLTEMQCLLENLKRFEQKAKIKEEHRLNPENFTELLRQYQKHLSEKKPKPHIVIQHDLAERARYSFKSLWIAFAHTFAFTLIDRYFVPLIISQTHSRKTALSFAFIAKGVVNALLASSVQAAALNIVLEKVMELSAHYFKQNTLLKQFNKAYPHSSAIVLYGSNYRDMLQAILTGAGSVFAVTLAHNVIRSLPKFRLESSPQPTAVVNKNPVPTGLTHRRK